MRVLITNIELWPPSGTVMYVRDIALELQRRGHSPSVFSSTKGAVADELRDAGITVTDRLSRLREHPDIIHGHHHAPTLVALGRWTSVPAIYICHDHMSANDATPIHANIHRYFGVSRVCVERLLRDGAPLSCTDLLLNFVDTARFVPRTPLPQHPRRALVFSNYAHAGSHLPAVREACRRAGLQLDVVGAGVGRIATKPERLLPRYDIVFAKAKAAMEAMSVGTAVILCDFSGVGPMVTTNRFEELRPLNFGYEALRDPLEPETIVREIARYDPADAAHVQGLLRTQASLVAAVETLVGIYEEAITEHRRDRFGSDGRQLRRRSIRDSLYLRLYRQWISLPARQRARLEPVAHKIKRGVRRVLGQSA